MSTARKSRVRKHARSTGKLVKQKRRRRVTKNVVARKKSGRKTMKAR